MSTPESKISLSATNKNFTDFEKEALGEVVLKTVESDLQQYLHKFHLQQMRDLEEKMAGFEKKCTQEIQKSIEQNVKFQLDAHFQEVVQACQKDITQVTSPLFKRAEKDVQSLTHTVSQATEVCSTIRAQYTLRWSNPFLVLIGTAGLAGALMGIFLLILQVPLISVFCMNAQTREAYETGLRVMEMRKELETQATSTPTTTPQEQEVPKTPENLKPKQKKKKASK
jgi:hypothetical protein